ncbi:MAG: hypothetical protein KC933_18140 [Myxococcales bacterium]|nr:hypothetical protein [Myxococcales bacterium]
MLYAAGRVAPPPPGPSDFDPGDHPFDHRGRARPLFTPAGPRPTASWRPGRLARLLLGLFPGARVMAVSSASAGLPYAVLGVAATVMVVLFGLEWSMAGENTRNLQIREVWLLPHAVALVCAVGVFELLRFGAALEERYYGSRAPRFLAALLLPAGIIVAFGPTVVRLWPQLVEAIWFMAVVVVLGALPATVWSAAEGLLMSRDRVRSFKLLVLAFFVVGVGGGVAALLTVEPAKMAVAHWASEAGFVLLPHLLGP